MIKKTFLSILGLLLFCSLSLAGSADQTALPAPQAEPMHLPPRIISGTYLTANVGRAVVDWVDFSRSPFTEYYTHPKGGLTYGFTVGYRFYRYFSLEGGIFRLPTVQGIGVRQVGDAGYMGVNGWIGYIAGRFYLHLFNYFYLDAAIGVTYRQTEPRPTTAFLGPEPYYYAPILSAGLEFDFAQNWLMYVQYYFVPSYSRDLPENNFKFFNVPNASLIVFGFGYKFSI